jgi:CheY-like chemotaxis protein
MSTILLVEDQPEQAFIWGRELDPLGAEIRMATTIASAIEMAKRLPPPDLIILDVKMPDAPGDRYSLVAIADFKRIYPDVIVIVTTGWPEERIRNLAQELGADGFQDKRDMDSQVKLFRALQECIQSRKLLGKQLTDCQTELAQKIAEILRLNPKRTQPLK